MIFKRCNWCKYCARLKTVDSRGTYRDSLCCLLPLINKQYEQIIVEVRPNASCKEFVDRPKPSKDKKN